MIHLRMKRLLTQLMTQSCVDKWETSKWMEKTSAQRSVFLKYSHFFLVKALKYVGKNRKHPPQVGAELAVSI